MANENNTTNCSSYWFASMPAVFLPTKQSLESVKLMWLYINDELNDIAVRPLFLFHLPISVRHFNVTFLNMGTLRNCQRKKKELKLQSPLPRFEIQ